jgi:hypothetical protein
MVRREDDQAAALRAAGAEVVLGEPLEPADVRQPCGKQGLWGV